MPERKCPRCHIPMELPPDSPLAEAVRKGEGVVMDQLPLNQVVCGDCLEVMRGFPDNSVDLVVTSPPYWGLRNYGPETVRVWGGDPKCKHEWGEWNTPYKSDNQHTRSKSSWNRPSRKENEAVFITKKCPVCGKAFEGTKTQRFCSLNCVNTLSNYQRLKLQSIEKFCSKCGAWRGSLGLEPHPQMFIDHLVEICREIRRVLKPSGTFWLNIGDTYFGGSGWKRDKNQTTKLEGGLQVHDPLRYEKKESNWLQPKQLLGMPWRTAAALQHDGWILRNDIIWYKPNHMPSSVKDRLTNAYEHVFLLAKARRYYFDLDAIRKLQETRQTSKIWDEQPINWDSQSDKKLTEGTPRWKGGNFGAERVLNPRGKNPGDLWRIPTAPFPGAHFATFPPKLIEPIVKAGCPRWICRRCGKPRTRIYKSTPPEGGYSFTRNVGGRTDGYATRLGKNYRANYEFLGWSDCGCGAGWNPGVVLDPFCGSGTALRVARKLRRNFIGIDINPKYCEMAQRRIRGDKYVPPPKEIIPLSEILEVESEGLRHGRPRRPDPLRGAPPVRLHGSAQRAGGKGQEDL